MSTLPQPSPSSKMMIEIDTAIPLLLVSDNDDNDDDDREIVIKEDSSKSNNDGHSNSKNKCDEDDDDDCDDHYSKKYLIKFVLFGLVTGFFIQVVSLGAYAFMLVQYTNNNNDDGTYNSNSNQDKFVEQFFDTWTKRNSIIMTDEAVEEESPSSKIVDLSSTEAVGVPPLSFFATPKTTFLHTILCVLTQLDLVVYVLIWIAFTCTMTRNGMACIHSQFFSSSSSSSSSSSCPNKNNKNNTNVNSNENKNSTNQKRYIFVLGVYFLVGIVLGAFGAWSMIDVYLGFPIPFGPIIVTVIIDLILCYFMVRCYDMGKEKRKNRKRKNDDDDDDDEKSCDYYNLFDDDDRHDGDDDVVSIC